MPRIGSGNMKNVSSVAMTMSQATTRPTPPANAGPCRHAMVGIGSDCSSQSRSHKTCESCCHSSLEFGDSARSCIWPRSIPAQKTLPVEFRTRTRTEESLPTWRTESSSAWMISRRKAFRLSGRSIVRVATPSLVFSRTCSDMVGVSRVSRF